jgi:hypothetical protein
MAYIEGQSLSKRIEEGPLGLEEALRIAEQVAEGLEAAHKKGIVHRDIKSANVMVTERGQAKIMDFGLARVTGSTLLTKDGSTMGTVAYMSPGQARGKMVDHRTDIWSFGVVLYEMLTGELPFKGEHEQAVIYAILKEKPEAVTSLRSEIPASIEQVVAKTLEKDPDKRYQQIDQLIDDLKSISAGIVPVEIKARLKKEKLRRRRKAILYAGTDVLMMYGEIARAVAGKLQVRLTAEEETRFAQARQALRTSPNNMNAHAVLWEVLHLMRKYDEALDEARAFYGALELTPVLEAMSHGYEKDGYPGAMRAAADTLAAISQQVYIGPWFIAYPYAAAGETEKTLEWLEKGFEIGDPNMPYIEEPVFVDLLSDEPRYQDLLRRMNMPEDE